MSDQHFYQEEGIVLSHVPSNCLCLDVGCGNGIYGYVIRVLKRPRLLVGCDISMSYLRVIKKHSIYDDVVCCDAAHLPFRENAFEAILASQVIEHLPREKGLKMLSDLDPISKNIIIVSTPNGFMPQGPRDDEASMIHRSGWRVKDFKARSFIVHGIVEPSFLPIHTLVVSNSTIGGNHYSC